MSKALQLLLAVALWLTGCYATIADECKVTAERSAQLAVAGAKRIEITARAGDLRIDGARDATHVKASGKACASEQKLLDLIQLELRLDGEVLHVDVRMPDIDALDVVGSAYATLDLAISLPDLLPLVILDSSGDTEISGVASTNMTDSSGDLRIRAVTGDVVVRDSSGDLWVEQVSGNLSLLDSSGEIDVADVRSDVLVEVDSSGSIELERVGRNVRIQQDSSGDIEIADVQGSVQIDSDGSGSVDVRGVGGAFTLGSKGSGDVRVAEVKGSVVVPPERQ